LGDFDMDRADIVHDNFLRRVAARDLPARTICLPLFVARWNHVTDDLPAALAAAGFAGPLLDPLGCDPAIPALLARGLAGAAD
jgi:sirohydrochlorin ferrochelatase